LAGGVGFLDVEHARGDSPAEGRPGQNLTERLPHREHGGGVTAQQFSGLVDRCLGVVGPVVANEDHRDRSVSVVKPACSLIVFGASLPRTCGSSACVPGATSENY